MRILQKDGKFISGRLRFRIAMNVAFLASPVLSFALLRYFHLEQMSFFVAAPLLILFTARFRDWQRWFPARKNKSTITEALKSLANDYVLLTHLALPDYGGEVEHFLVGPNGLFVIEATNYSGYVRCNQDEWAVNSHRIKSLSKQVKRNSIALRSAIASLYTERGTGIPYVTPVLVFANPEARLRLRRPTMAALRLEELPKFIRDYTAKRPITQEEKRLIIHHLMSLDSKSAEAACQTSITNQHLLIVK